jgi:subtilisin family serine protease
VAIVDTGCDDRSPDLAGLVVGGWTYNTTNGPGYADLSAAIRAPVGHGTHIASLLAAKKDNGYGLAGVAPGTPLLIVATAYGVADMTAGIHWSIEHSAKVIVLAWGTAYDDAGLSNACWRAWVSNVVIVAAVLNAAVNTDTTVDYPTSWRLPNVLPVTNTDRSGNLYGAAAWGTNTLAAPGRNLLGSGLNGSFVYGSGTSYSAPLVAGGLALLMERFPGQSAAAYVQNLRDTGKPVSEGKTRQMNLAAALQAPVPWLSIDRQGVTLFGLPDWNYTLERSVDGCSWQDYVVVVGRGTLPVAPGWYRARVGL